MSTLLADLRYGIRLLWKSPGFTVIAVLALALGIGANTAIFTAVDTILVRPLPYHDPDRLAVVWEDTTKAGFPKNTPAPANFVDWRKQNQVFTDMAALRGTAGNLTSDGQPEFVVGTRATPTFFSVMGVPAEVGRTLTADDDRAGVNVIVLSHGLWVRRYGAERNVIGKTIRFNDEKFVVVGVMPRGFKFPFKTTDFWMPARFTPEDLARRGSHFLTVIARLKPGVTFERADSDMKTIAERLKREYPRTNSITGALVVPLKDEIVDNTRTGLIVLLVGAGCVLLIACANVANLLLARAAGRQREMAVRTALGAGRARLIRQMATESTLLALIGGILGVFLARWGILALKGLTPFRMDVTMTIDWRVLLFAAVVSLGTGLLFGIIPALHASRLELHDALKQGGRGSAGERSGLFRDALVVAEVALALVLLVGAGLMIRTLFNLRAVEVGFQPDNLLTMRSYMPTPKYSDPQKRQRFYDAVLEKVRSMPGVQGAAFISQLPFESTGNTSGFQIEGRPETPGGNVQDALFRVATNEYLRTLGARLDRGRFFSAEDRADSLPVIIVNQTLVRQFFTGVDPIGKRISFDGKKWITIVGVVREVRERGIEPGLKPGVYLPVVQNPDAWAVPGEILVRTEHDPLQLAGAVRDAIWSEDRDLAVSGIQTMNDLVDRDIASRSQQMTLLGAFAGLALALASLGIYGVLSYAVTQRTREIGVRMALGAKGGDVVRMVAGKGMLLTGIGLVLGGVGAVAATRAMQSMLFEVAPADPRTFALVGIGLAMVAFFACAIPAARASRVDPMIALRDE